LHKCQQTFSTKDTDVEPEVDVQVDDEGHVSGTVRIVNQCSDCGEELEETTFEIDIDLTQDVTEHQETAEHQAKLAEAKDRRADQGSVSVEAEFSRTDETQRKDRRGKPITSRRYMKRYYGIEGSVSITCDQCGVEIASQNTSDKCSASGMESLS
jgi:predicted phage gp36 major capsid-like protein